jgi:hypothetical protein
MCEVQLEEKEEEDDPLIDQGEHTTAGALPHDVNPAGRVPI